MEPNNNANSEHSTVAVTHHPLQDIPLNNDSLSNQAAAELAEERHEAISGMPQNNSNNSSSVKANSKMNWVKFDDEVSSGGIQANENNNSNSVDFAAAAATNEVEGTVSNKLSSLPPPPSKHSSTTTTNATHSTLMQESNNTTATPVQRSTISSTTQSTDVAPAVLNTESTHVNLNASGINVPQQQKQQTYQKSKVSNSAGASSSVSVSAAAATAVATSSHQANQLSSTTSSTHHNGSTASSNKSSGAVMSKTSANPNGNGNNTVAIPVETSSGMQTIELSTGRIREGFANGDVIVTLLPANTKWPWITPAIFRPELVPEELMAQGLTLTVEDYVHAMETLVNDYRFTVYNICYKRILVCWILFAFIVLLTLLFSGLQGVALFSLGVGWLFLNAAAIFLCMWVKLRLSRGLEKCLARVNKQLMKHKILLILDDRGRISCHKVNLCFLYFDSTQCVSFLNEFLEQTEQNGGEAIKAGWESKLDIDLEDIVIQGNNPVRLSRKQERGMQLFLRYGSRWGMEALRGLVDVTALQPARHCGQFQCPCQYIKEHLQCKPRGKLKCLNWVYWVLASERYDY